jgi:hypothetical protein
LLSLTGLVWPIDKGLKMEIKLYLLNYFSSVDYCMERFSNESTWFACYRGLNSFFFLDDAPEEITMVFSENKHKNSYFCTAVDSKAKTIDVRLSNKENVRLSVFTLLYKKIDSFPNGCYVSVVA